MFSRKKSGGHAVLQIVANRREDGKIYQQTLLSRRREDKPRSCISIPSWHRPRVFRAGLHVSNRRARG